MLATIQEIQMSFPQPEDILTPRLALIAITPETVLSEKAGDNRLGEIIRCIIPSAWPHADWEPHVFDFFLNQFAQHPDQIGWPRYIALPQPNGTRTLIGTVGAFSKTDPPAICEIGYGILPPYEGCGFATEATQALIAHLRKDQRVCALIAHTYPSILASLRIMEKCGLTYDGNGEEPGTIRYRLCLRTAGSLGN
jgi:[ribosomal protein S5]-alanine N-acetyltransferase